MHQFHDDVILGQPRAQTGTSVTVEILAAANCILDN